LDQLSENGTGEPPVMVPAQKLIMSIWSALSYSVGIVAIPSCNSILIREGWPPAHHLAETSRSAAREDKHERLRPPERVMWAHADQAPV